MGLGRVVIEAPLAAAAAAAAAAATSTTAVDLFTHPWRTYLGLGFGQ